MKLIFLDFDGVVITGNTRYFEMGYYGSDNDAIANLNKIIEATGAKIVVSSTYRYGETEGSLRYRLRNWGVKEPNVMGLTPVLWGAKPRGCEIQKFLDEWYEKGWEDIESFIILDDRCDMAHLSSHLVQTNPMEGISETDVLKAIDKLNNHTYAYEKVGMPGVMRREKAMSAAVTSGYVNNLPACEICGERVAKTIHVSKQDIIDGIQVPVMTCLDCRER